MDRGVSPIKILQLFQLCKLCQIHCSFTLIHTCVWKNYRLCNRLSVDAFSHYTLSNTSADDGSLDGIYLDGVSITHGFPRSHIWSFGAGHGGTSRCPCDNPNTNVAVLPPSFIGDNYFCDGEYNGALWDGQNCTTSCCLFHSPPWFKASLPAPTSDAIEVRISADQQSPNESVFIGALKIFVQ